MKRVSESRLLSSLALALALGGCGDAASLEEPTIVGQRKMDRARALGAVGFMPQLDLAPGQQSAGLALRLSF